MPARLLYCHCSFARVVPVATKVAVLDGLSRAPVAFDAVPDLCEMSARKDPRLTTLAGEGPLRVAACYPRAVRWLFASAGTSLPDNAQVINMRTDAPDDVLRALLAEEAP